MRKFVVLLMTLLFIGAISFAQKADTIATFTIPTVQGTVGTDVSVPITVSSSLGDSLRIGALGFKVAFDITTLKYKKTVVSTRFLQQGGANLNTNVKAGDFLVQFAFSSAGYFPARFAQNEVIATITFTVLGVSLTPPLISNLEVQPKPMCSSLEGLSFQPVFINGKIIDKAPNPLTIDVQPVGTSVCDGSEAKFSLTATNALTYIWQESQTGTFADLTEGAPYTGVTSTSLTINPTSAAMNNYQYRCIVANGNDPDQTSDAVALTVNALPSVSIDPSGTQTLNMGGNVVLTASGADTFQWYKDGTIIPGANAITYTVTFMTQDDLGSYTVMGTNVSTCSATSAPVIVQSGSEPLSVVVNSDLDNICAGTNTVNITAVATGGNAANYSYTWNPDQGNVNTFTATNLTQSETYSVTVSDGLNTANGSVTVNVIPLPVALVTPEGATTVCSPEKITLNAQYDQSYSYQWQTAGNNIPGATTSQYVADASGDYLVIVSVGICSSTSNSTTVTVNPKPIVNITGSSTIPASTTTTLTAEGNEISTYQWYNSGTIIPDATNSTYEAGTGSYTVMVVGNNTCSNESALFTVTETGSFSVKAVATPGTICEGQTTDLSVVVTGGTAPFSYLWADDQGNLLAMTDTYTVTPTKTGQVNYKVAVVDAAMKTAADSVWVTVNTIPTATITPADVTTFCEGGNVVLNANTGNGYTYQWTRDGQNIGINESFTATVAGKYNVVITANGCTSAESNSIDVIVNPMPTAVIEASLDITEGMTGTLHASTGTSYNYEWWKDGNIIQGEANSDLIINATDQTAAGNYSVKITVNGCTTTSNFAVVTVTPLANFSVTVNANPSTVCEGSTSILTAIPTGGTAPYTYKWDDGITTTQTYTATPISGKAINVTVTDFTNTTAVGTVTVIVNPTPTALISPITVDITSGPQTLTASTGSSYAYQWYLNNNIIPGANASTLSVNEIGSYTVIITANGCSKLSNYATATMNGVICTTPPLATNLVAPVATVLQTSVVLNWSFSGDATAFTFVARAWKVGCDTCYFYRKVTNGSNTAKLSDLEPNTLYYLDVQAYCPNEKWYNSGYTEPISVTTLGGIVCKKVYNQFQPTSITKTSAILSWQREDNATMYKIRYFRKSDVVPGYRYKKVLQPSSGNPTYPLRSLQPATTFKWQVKVICGAANGPGQYASYPYGELGGSEFTTLPVKKVLSNTNVTSDVDMSIYPNPSNGEFTINISGINTSSTLIITNIQGEEVYNQTISTSLTKDVDLTSLAKGMYFVKLSNENTVKVSKIVIE